MIIKIEDLTHNPFRDPKRYPVDEDKVLRLMKSITDTHFWNNLIARPHPTEEGKYELGYGQHRIEALRRLHVEEIDIPVREMSDMQMLRVLVCENEEFNVTRTSKYIIENVDAAKKFIEDHLAEKKGIYADLDPWCRDLFDGEEGFNRSMGQDKVASFIHFTVGWKIIANFLGDSWDRNQIKFALLHFPKGPEKAKVSKKATTQVETPWQGVKAAKALLSPAGQIAFPTPEDQERVVSDVLDEFQDEADANGDPTPKITGEKLEDKIMERAEVIVHGKILGHDPQVEKLTEDLPVERSSEVLQNRKYFKKVLRGFNTFTTHPSHIAKYSRSIAYTDFQILHLMSQDIISRLKEYEQLFGFKSKVEDVVYDFYDAVTAEEVAVMDAWLGDSDDCDDIGMSVEDWCECDPAWIASMDEVADGNSSFPAELEDYMTHYVKEDQE